MNTAPRTSGIAIASLVFGVLSWVALPVIGAILAVILGANARSEIRRAPPGAIDGDGMALAGLILGWVHLALFIAIIGLVFLFLGGLAFFAHVGH
ncbi:MAG TPA: DUF4190 domain-containing protein [Rhodanobacteraceae bacterium]|jgi:hypothetical protein|nr:DUF4190 domain-containing protein [Rhodanobacteraceae bacterium]